MSGRLAPALRIAITSSSSFGYITVDLDPLLLIGARCWISNPGGTIREYVEIVSKSDNLIYLRKLSGKNTGPSYGRSDMSAFASGFIDQEEQMVYSRYDP